MNKWLIVLGALLVAAPAHARANLEKTVEGYTYYHRAGVTRAFHDDAIRACAQDVATFNLPGGGRPGSPYQSSHISGGALAGGLAGALLAGVYQNSMQARHALTNIENCMVFRGWDVVRLPQDVGAKIDKLPPAEKNGHLTALIESPSPQGEVARRFENDGSLSNAARFKGAGKVSIVSLSISTLDPKFLQNLNPAPPKTLPKVPKSAYPSQPMAPGTVREIPAGMGLVVVQLKQHGTNWRRFTFLRDGPDAETPSWVDGKPGGFFIAPRLSYSGRLKDPEMTFVYAVPPGRYSLRQVMQVLAVDFCLGAPVFDVAAGDVVFAGAFDADAERFGPSLDLTSARGELQAAPAIAAAMKPAAYQNGAAYDCDELGISYGLEIPGAPSLPGYAYGFSTGGAP
jgi:hypothetical protein